MTLLSEIEDMFSVAYRILDNSARDWAGRHVVHDSRSWDFRTGDRSKPPTRAAEHRCHVAPWDQGNIGDCTMNAGCGLLVTEPFWTPAMPAFTEADIVPLYGEETRLDDSQIPGQYPPNDTGSCGLFSMKVLKRHGWIDGYETPFGLNAVLNTLLTRPVSVGTNWYDSMEEPDHSGLMKISRNAQSVGGHQWAIVGVDPATQRIKMRQSWGESWGDHGYGYLSWSDLDRLLHEQGDAITPKLRAAR